jgi:glutamine synthetase
MNQLHLTYIWLDGFNKLRQKVKIHNIIDTYDIFSVRLQEYLKNIDKKCRKQSDLFENLQANIKYIPLWNYDGSSTGQASSVDSEVILVPQVLYPTPFHYEDSPTMYRLLVLCETYLSNATENSLEYVPHPTNKRHQAKIDYNKPMSNLSSKSETLDTDFKPLYGIEQEFFITDNTTGFPVDYNENDIQGRFYCAVDSNLNKILDNMLSNCLSMGLNVVGSNCEVAPGQAEIQLLEYGLKACDDLVMLRYVIIQTAIEFKYNINFDPKPLKGAWNGSGAHVNYSTLFMRSEEIMFNKYINNDIVKTPYDHIMHSISQLSDNHQKHIDCYGKGNEERLTGEHETSSMNIFTYGVADRGASVRIPRTTFQNKYGYIEDRRPSSNFDPYVVLPLILITTTSNLIK